MLLATLQSRPRRGRVTPFLLFLVVPLFLLQQSKDTCGWSTHSLSLFTPLVSHHLQPLMTTSARTISINSSNNMDSTEMQQQQQEQLQQYPTDSPQYYSSFRVLGVCGGIGSGKSTACRLLVSPDQSTMMTNDDDVDVVDVERNQTVLGGTFGVSCLAHIDADSVAHSVYAPGSQAVQDIVSEFGSGILLDNNDDNDDLTNNHNKGSSTTMEIDRKKLGAIVFADQSAMAKLETIVWPHVKKLIMDRIEESRHDWKTTMVGMLNPTDGGATTTNTSSSLPRPIVVLEAAVLLDAGWDDLLDGVWVITTPTSVALERLMQTRGLSQEEAQKRIDAQQSRRGIGSNIQDEIDKGIITGVIENSGSLESLKKSLIDALDDPNFWKQSS